MSLWYVFYHAGNRAGVEVQEFLNSTFYKNDTFYKKPGSFFTH